MNSQDRNRHCSAKSPLNRKHREQVFWDRQSAVKGESLPSLNEMVPIEVQREPAYRFYLSELGDLHGKRVLECGCGDGKFSVLLALAGARVDAFDISPVSVELCKRRADACGVGNDLRVLVADLESLPYLEKTFDIVCGTFILHHTDVSVAARNISRVIKPDGQAVFLENSAANPFLTLGRRYLVGRFNIPRIGSPDEYPLTVEGIKALRLMFGKVEVYFPQMVFLRLALYRLVWAALPTSRFPSGPLRRLGNWLWNLGPLLDNAIYDWLPFLRKYSWWQVLVMSEPL